MGSKMYSLRVHYRREPRNWYPRQIPVTGGSMSIHGSISLMLFKLQKSEKGDFFEPFKNQASRYSLAGVLEFYSEYIICTNIPYDQAEYISKLSYP